MKRPVQKMVIKDPVNFHQFDGLIGVQPNAFGMPDKDGDLLLGAVTPKPIKGSFAVRVLIPDGVAADDAKRMLHKIVACIEDGCLSLKPNEHDA